jgi:hypothetical protein
MSHLVGPVSIGAFVHAATADDCLFCEVSRGWGPDPANRAPRKLGAAALAAYRRLVANA